MIHRRGLLTGLGALIAAPAIVRAASLMPVRRPPLLIYDRLWIRKMIRPAELYGVSPFMIYLEHARDEVVRMTAIPPELFYRRD